MKKRIGIVLAALVLFLLIAAVASVRLWPDPPLFADYERGSETSARRVLVFTFDTPFRQAVSRRVADELAKEGVWVLVTDVRRIGETPVDAFDAVVLLDTVKAWSLSKEVDRLLRSTPDKNRFVLVPCAGDPDYRADYPGIDTVTGASAKGSDPESIAREILAKVRARLTPLPPEEGLEATPEEIAAAKATDTQAGEDAEPGSAPAPAAVTEDK